MVEVLEVKEKYREQMGLILAKIEDITICTKWRPMVEPQMAIVLGILNQMDFLCHARFAKEQKAYNGVFYLDAKIMKETYEIGAQALEVSINALKALGFIRTVERDGNGWEIKMDSL